MTYNNVFNHKDQCNTNQQLQTMNLTEQQKRIIEQVVNVFETGKPAGNYGKVTIMADGPGNQRQITYGRSQTTEYSNLGTLVRNYVSSNGIFSSQLQPYVNSIGVSSLVDDTRFIQLLRDSGNNDPMMVRVQDQFFDHAYYLPAIAWAESKGFRLALSALVIYDSFIHSGKIRDDIRAMFTELPPSDGGNERIWVEGYVDARARWLANHSNQLLHRTVYRTDCFRQEIARNNWDLNLLPVIANGVEVYG